MSSTSGPAGPPLSPSEQEETLVPGVLAVAIIFSTLPFIVVPLRVLSRRISNLPLWWDDYLVIACLPLIILQLCFIVQAVHNGLGRHLGALPESGMPQTLYNYLMWTFASELYYPFVVTFIKSSILLLYIRLFRVEVGFRRFCYGLLVFVAAWGVSVLFSTIFQCVPVQAAWIKPYPTAQCFNLRTWLIGTNVPNILVDVVIICAPMPLIWRLKLSWWRKVSLCGIFLLAFATTVISILRVTANANINVTDPTWSFTPIAEFSTIEGSVGVLCACLPTLAPLFRVCAGKRPVSTKKNTYNGPDSGLSNQSSGPPRRHQQFSQLEDGDDDNNQLVHNAAHAVELDERKQLPPAPARQQDYYQGPTMYPGAMPLKSNHINVRSDIWVASGREQ